MILSNRPKQATVLLSLCLTGMTFPSFIYCPGFADPSTTENPVDNKTPSASSSSSGDMNFGSGGWSIVPAGTPSPPKKSNIDSSTFSTRANPSFHSGSTTKTKSDWTQPTRPPSSVTNTESTDQQAAVPPPESKPLRLYGRIEELCDNRGAKIPLKLQAMTPIRDSSLDPKTPKLAAKVDTKFTKLSGTQNAKTDFSKHIGDIEIQQSNLSTSITKNEPSFPINFRGTWTGPLTIEIADESSSYVDWDRAQAEKQAQLLKPGTVGKCTVNFYQGSGDRVEVQPTNVMFRTTVSLAEGIKSMGNSPFAGMLGGVDPNNPMFANMQIPYPFSLPLGQLVGNRGVSGNELSSQLMKNSVKELSKGVLEQQTITHDSDRSANGQTRTYYTESVMRFSYNPNDTLGMQAAQVSYDDDGNYLSKVILSGTLTRGGSTSTAPEVYTMFGGNQNQQQGSSGLGGDLFGGGNNNNGQNGGNNMMEQMQQLLQQFGGGGGQ